MVLRWRERVYQHNREVQLNAYDITVWDDGGIHVVQVTGEFDVSACQPFREAADVHGFELVVVDLRDASFIDSHALGELIALHNRAQREEFRLAIIRPQGHADRIFNITGSDGHLPLHDERIPLLAQMNYG
jgi:anti-anti-sigma factor